MKKNSGRSLSRRRLLAMIGMSAGSTAMYQAMHSLGFAGETTFTGPIQLSGAPKGASVLVLGAGIAGLVAAYELRNAGYRVQVLEFNNRPGGRNWTLRGGDRYTELGGATQECRFDPGLYINPGPWRLPYHHRGMLSYCKRLGVALEPFVQINYNAYMHSRKAFGGKPQRLRNVKADYHGHIAELLAKATQSHSLDGEVTAEDQAKLLDSLRFWGALDGNLRYVKGANSSDRRGYERDPGGGLSARPQYSEPVGLSDTLNSGLWGALPFGEIYDLQTTLFQPVGGMDGVSKAFARELAPMIKYNAKVVEIHQDEHGVRAAYENTAQAGAIQTAQADWCVCTIPLSILGQIPINVGEPMANAIAAVPYYTSIKVGLQFKRRFWEEDEQIYGGITYTDLPIGQISYPSSGFFGSGKGVLLGAYIWQELDSMEFTAMSPDERVAKAVEYGSQIHPHYREEFDNGVSVAWHRAPFAMGCFGLWTEATRAQHYDNLCGFDGRIVLAGEHASYLSAWQEGAVTSALDAIDRLHRRAVAAGAAV
ncbi:MAG TPA: flavin monoamine oxidase family protein [Steroidobacteraceae bacterium]|jgi:monoamine oxidase|nr:flavin monoamine oxidase family protein [Steroidobacteraceae bacterium]